MKSDWVVKKLRNLKNKNMPPDSPGRCVKITQGGAFFVSKEMVFDNNVDHFKNNSTGTVYKDTGKGMSERTKLTSLCWPQRLEGIDITKKDFIGLRKGTCPVEFI